MKKDAFIKVLAIILVLCVVMTACSTGSGETVPVQAVSMIAGFGHTGLYSRYSGLVVSQNAIEFNLDETKTIKEILVAVGDEVVIDQPLFSYDTDEMQLRYEQAKLELEQLKNSVTTKQNQIKVLEADKKKAPASEQLSYTIEIQALEADIKSIQYNITLKDNEIKRMSDSLADTDVKSTINGRVQSINPDGGTDNSGRPLALMTVVESGTYRIKGTINELNMQDLVEGTPVVIRSRVDESITWSGVVSGVDWENPVQDNNSGMYYYGPQDEMTTSSKYPFFVSLDNIDGLMLGQHVFIEPSGGQTQQNSGLWLPSYYINDLPILDMITPFIDGEVYIDGQPYVEGDPNMEGGTYVEGDPNTYTEGDPNAYIEGDPNMEGDAYVDQPMENGIPSADTSDLQLDGELQSGDVPDGSQSSADVSTNSTTESSVTPWVWAAGKNDRLEKRELVLGQYDPSLDQYEVISGLTLDDYIAMPNEAYTEGMRVEYYDEEYYAPTEGGDYVMPEGEPIEEMPGEKYYEEVPMDDEKLTSIPEADVGDVIIDDGTVAVDQTIRRDTEAVG